MLFKIESLDGLELLVLCQENIHGAILAFTCEFPDCTSFRVYQEVNDLWEFSLQISR